MAGHTKSGKSLSLFSAVAKIALMAGALSLAALAPTACARKERADGDTTLHIGNVAEPLSLDPHQASGTWENRIIGDMFMGLVTDDPNGLPIPGVAESWTTSADGLVWTFHLRNSVWSDNVPVTADDFVYAWQRLLTLTPPAKYASILYLVKNAQDIFEGKKPATALGIRAIDAHTLEVTLNHPAPYFPGLLTHYTTFPVPKHVVEKYGNDWIKPEHIQTNGAFKLVQWAPGDFVHVVASPTFFDAANVCLTQQFYYPTPDDATAARRVRSGSLDIQTNFLGSQLERLRAEMPGFPRIHSYVGITYYVLNQRRAPFNDARVREALNLAIDREFLTASILQGGQTPAYSMVPPGIQQYESGAASLNFKAMDRTARLARARQLLSEAGYGPNKPLNFSIAYRNSGDNPRVLPVVQQNWREIAPWVTPQLEAADSQVNYERLRQGDFDVGDAGWIADFNDARNFLYLFETRTGVQNYGHYSNPRFDALMEQSDHAVSAEARQALLQQAEQIMLDDNAFVPAFFLTNRNLVNPRVTGWVDNATDIHRGRYLCTREAEIKRAAVKH